MSQFSCLLKDMQRHLHLISENFDYCVTEVKIVIVQFSVGNPINTCFYFVNFSHIHPLKIALPLMSDATMFDIF